MAAFHYSAELEGLLRYTTGSYNVPPAGYSAGCIRVAFQEHVIGITASTCVLQLTLSRNYETFACSFKSCSSTRKKILYLDLCDFWNEFVLTYTLILLVTDILFEPATSQTEYMTVTLPLTVYVLCEIISIILSLLRFMTILAVHWMCEFCSDLNSFAA